MLHRNRWHGQASTGRGTGLPTVANAAFVTVAAATGAGPFFLIPVPNGRQDHQEGVLI